MAVTPSARNPHIVSLPPRGTLPSRVRNMVWCHRLGYVTVNVLLLVWLWSFRGSWLVDSEGNTQGGMASMLILLVISTSVAFAAVQGSNPGYVYGDNQDASTDPTAWTSKSEFDHLMDRGEEVDDGDIELGAAASGATHLAGSADLATGHAGGASPGGDDSDEPQTMEQRLEAAEAQPGADALLPGGAFQAADGRVRCIWCAVQQPVRAHHCKACNMCVHGFDHHCGFLGTCIGEANRCRFWWFLTLQMLTVCVGVAVAHSCFQSQHSWGWGTWAGINAVAFVQVFVHYLLLVFLASLWGLHTWLAVTNGTTYELIRGPRGVWYLGGTEMCDIPFSRGIMRNLSEFCCVRDGLVAAAVKRQWTPRSYTPPIQAQPLNRNSDDVIENIWENRYYSCC